MSGTSKPNSQAAANRQARWAYMNKVKRLAFKTRKRRAAIVGGIAEEIWRYHQRGIYQWRLKDLIWFFDYYLVSKKANDSEVELRARSLVDLLVCINRKRWMPLLKLQSRSLCKREDLTRLFIITP